MDPHDGHSPAGFRVLTMSASNRLVLLTDIVSPYRIPVFRLLAELVDLHVILLADADKHRAWEPFRGDGTFSVEVLPALPFSQHLSLGRRPLHLNRSIRATLRRARPDVVLIGGWSQPAFWAALRPTRRWKAAIWVESTQLDERPISIWRSFMKRTALRLADAAVVPGTASKKYVEALSPGKPIVVAPNAVDVDWFAEEHGSSVRDELCRTLEVGAIACFIAEVSYSKGIDIALDAVAGLRKGVGIVVLGDGPERANWERYATCLDIGEKTRFEGFVSAKRVAQVLHASDVLLFPTRSDPWGLVVNEAQAAGCPTISSDRAGVADELLADGSGVVLSLQDDWIGALSAILSDPALASRLAHAGKAAAQKHSPGACAQGLASLMDALQG
jgi:glycosyltransferase involved in cell wall biosynthesis